MKTTHTRLAGGTPALPGAERAGSVLLEVILALVLFAAAATVIGIALNASMQSVERLRLGAQAADLSVTVFSELQLGIRSVTEPASATPKGTGGSGTNAWEVEITAQPWGGTGEGQTGTLTDVEVVLRHESGYVHRARQIMRMKSEAPLAGRGHAREALPVAKARGAEKRGLAIR